MTSPRDTSLVEEERADVNGADRDGAKREERATESDYRDLNYASLRLMVVVSVRTYAFHMLRTYVMILCNWLIL